MTPIIVANAAGTIVFINNEVCLLVDCDTYDLVGHDFFTFLDDGGTGLRELLEAHQHGEPAVRHSNLFRRPNGGRIELTFEIHPVLDVAGGELLLHVSVGVAHRIVGLSREGTSADQLREAYPYTSLSYEEGQAIYRALKRLMRDEQPYLKAELSLEDVAKAIGTNQLYLSQAINFFAGCNFREFLNYSRLDYLREHPDLVAETNVDQLWRVAGFGSYSAFRRYLKTAEGVTPARFRRELAEELSERDAVSDSTRV